MKRSIALVLAVVCLGTFAKAQQCDKKYKLIIERTVLVNADSTDGEDLSFTVDIKLSKDSIYINIAHPDGNASEINGKHSSVDCKMNADYSNGSIEYKTDAVLTSGSNVRDMKMQFFVEAKEGKFRVIGFPTDKPDEKICFYVKEKQEIK